MIPLDEFAAGLGTVIQQAEAGVTTIVTKNGRPVLRVVPAQGEPSYAGDLIAQARTLRATIAAGEAASELIHEARREAGRL